MGPFFPKHPPSKVTACPLPPTRILICKPISLRRELLLQQRERSACIKNLGPSGQGAPF